MVRHVTNIYYKKNITKKYRIISNVLNENTKNHPYQTVFSCKPIDLIHKWNNLNKIK